ncbi:hypothetical protein [Streptomyces sp. NBC_01276]
MNADAEQLRPLPADQHEQDDPNEDVTRLTPLRHANLNALGRRG